MAVEDEDGEVMEEEEEEENCGTHLHDPNFVAAWVSILSWPVFYTRSTYSASLGMQMVFEYERRDFRRFRLWVQQRGQVGNHREMVVEAEAGQK